MHHKGPETQHPLLRPEAAVLDGQAEDRRGPKAQGILEAPKARGAYLSEAMGLMPWR